MDTTKKHLTLGEKITIKKRIHTLEFKETKEDLKCFRCIECHQVAILQVQLQCYHILCDDCFATLQSNRCPAPGCSMQVTPCQEQDIMLEQGLSELKVTCQNKASNCPEIVPLCNLLETRELAECRQQIKDLKQQVKEIKMSVVQLQQSCGQPCPQMDMKIKEIVSEEIRKVKEEVELKGKEEQERILRDLEKGFMERYESEKENLKNDVIRALDNSELESDVSSLPLGVNHLLPKSKTLIWDIGNFKDKINDEELIIDSDIFHIPEFECKIGFSFYLKSQHGWDFDIQVRYYEHAIDEANPLTDHHRITFTLKDHLENNKYKDFVRVFQPSFCNMMSCNLGSFRILPKDDEFTFLHSRWLKGGKIEMRVTLEPLAHLVTTEPHCYGSIIWKIDHYADVCESFRYGRQWAWSESFYSSERGYRLKGYFYIGQDVYFGLSFLKGPWDNYLPKKFKHWTKFCIISQDDKRQLKDRTFTKGSSGVHCDEFNCMISEANLKKYVKNDSLVISFEVEPLKRLLFI